MFMYKAHVYDSKDDDDYLCYYSGAFVLGGDIEKEFTKNHWTIDSGRTDHLTPFKNLCPLCLSSKQTASIDVWSWKNHTSTTFQRIRINSSGRSVVHSTCST